MDIIICSERIVADSIRLIALERISYLDILPALFEPVLIPPAVEQEFGISLPWLKLERLFDQTLAVALKMMLDDGEAEAIALVQEQKCRIILDDRQARSAGGNMGLGVIGTVGTLILAKQKGILIRCPALDLTRSLLYRIVKDLWRII